MIGPGGRDITPTSPARQAILAIVALSPQARLSRTRLMTLFWPSSTPKKAQSSLRAALFKLRRDLDRHAPGLLVVDDHVVALEPAMFERDVDNEDTPVTGELLEGLDVPLRDSEGLESWLRQERAAWAGRQAESWDEEEEEAEPVRERTALAGNGAAAPSRGFSSGFVAGGGPVLRRSDGMLRIEPRVRLTVGHLDVLAGSEPGRILGRLLLDQVTEAAERSGVAIPVDRAEDRADIRLEVSVAELTGEWLVGLRLHRRDSLQSSQVAEVRMPADLGRALASEGLVHVVDRAVDAIVRQKPIGVDLGMTGLVTEISAMYLAGQDERLALRAGLAQQIEAEGTGSPAIRSFLETFILGESLDDGEPSDAQLTLALGAADTVYQGRELNPVELSLAGYGLDFIAADRPQAFNLMHEAVHAGPEVALVWDNLAISYFRHGDFERARGAAEQALKFGYASPLIGIFETTYCMTCLASGDTAAAAYYGLRALRRNGAYLSACCHAAAAVALAGDLPAAEALVGQMKTLRPDISLAMIEERFMARFPPHAQDVLLRGLRLAGLT